MYIKQLSIKNLIKVYWKTKKNAEDWQQPSGLKHFETSVLVKQRKSMVSSLNKAAVYCVSLSGKDSIAVTKDMWQ